MRVEIYESRKRPRPLNSWYLRLVAKNGETLATSEGYFSKWNAKRAAAKNFPTIPVTIIDE